MTKIRLIKPMAKRRIKSHIYEGEHLTRRLTYENLLQTRQRQERWSQNIIGDLGRMFTDKELAHEFRLLSLVASDDNDSHADEMDKLVDVLNRQLEWLGVLAGRIDEFPQAHNTPVVSRLRAL